MGEFKMDRLGRQHLKQLINYKITESGSTKYYLSPNVV